MSTFDLGNNISILNKLPWFADARFATIADAENNQVWDESKIIYIEDQDPHWYTYDSSGNCIPVVNNSGHIVNTNVLSNIGTTANTCQDEINAAIDEIIGRTDLNRSLNWADIASDGECEVHLIPNVDNWFVKVPSIVDRDLAVVFKIVTYSTGNPIRNNKISVTIVNESEYTTEVNLTNTKYELSPNPIVSLSDEVTIYTDDENVKVGPGESVKFTYRFYYDAVHITTTYLTNKEKFVEGNPSLHADAIIELSNEANWIGHANVYAGATSGAGWELFPGQCFCLGDYYIVILDSEVIRICKSREDEFKDCYNNIRSQSGNAISFDLQKSATTCRIRVLELATDGTYYYPDSIIVNLPESQNKQYLISFTEAATTLPVYIVPPNGGTIDGDSNPLLMAEGTKLTMISTDGINYYSL